MRAHFVGGAALLYAVGAHKAFGCFVKLDAFLALMTALAMRNVAVFLGYTGVAALGTVDPEIVDGAGVAEAAFVAYCLAVLAEPALGAEVASVAEEGVALGTAEIVGVNVAYRRKSGKHRQHEDENSKQ